MNGPLFSTKGKPGIDRAPVGVSFGCGVDSTAMLLGLYDLGLIPDVVQFADTGAEKPSTYQFLFTFDDWLASHRFRPAESSVWHRPAGYEVPEFGLPARREMKAIVVVKNDGKYGTLEANCLEKRMVPSLAYGGRSCSEKYKHRPMHKWMKGWLPARRWWGLDNRNRKTTDRLCTKLIGYDAGEWRRSDITGDGFYSYRYPLREWKWERPRCLEVIARHGLEVPPKSSCYFCPAMKKNEIVELGTRFPSLLNRALEMERAAVESGNLKKVKGLGRNWAWNDFVKEQAPSGKPFRDPTQIGCVCQPEVYEGEGADADLEECGPEE